MNTKQSLDETIEVTIVMTQQVIDNWQYSKGYLEYVKNLPEDYATGEWED